MSPPKRNRQGLSRREWRERQNGAGPSREREAPTYEDISPATSPAPRRRRLDLENERQEQSPLPMDLLTRMGIYL